MTNQEIFDTVVAHLRSMPQRSIGDDGECLYRGRDANGNITKCAAGILIPDDAYDGEMEGGRFHEVCLSYEGLSHFKPSRYFINALQAAHDSKGSWDKDGFSAAGEERLAECAEQFGLQYAPPHIS